MGTISLEELREKLREKVGVTWPELNFLQIEALNDNLVVIANCLLRLEKILSGAVLPLSAQQVHETATHQEEEQEVLVDPLTFAKSIIEEAPEELSENPPADPCRKPYSEGK